MARVRPGDLVQLHIPGQARPEDRRRASANGRVFVVEGVAEADTTYSPTLLKLRNPLTNDTMSYATLWGTDIIVLSSKGE